MATYYLEPKDRESPAWTGSAYRGPCVVGARSAEEARRLACGAFAVLRGEDREPAPWLDEGLVRCLQLDDLDDPQPHGKVTRVRLYVVHESRTAH